MALDLTVTDSMKESAAIGLRWRREYGRGGTRVGIARARDIVNRSSLPEDTWVRMFSFFSRHEVDKEAEGFRDGEEGFPSNGRIAWELWGGDSGFSKSRRIANQIRENNMSNFARQANLPLASREREWDGDAARMRMINAAREGEEINKSKANRGFAIVINNGENQSDYKLPFADVVNGELMVVFRGVSAALGRLNQVEGATQKQIQSAKDFLEAQRDRFSDRANLIKADSILASPRNLYVNNNRFDVVDDSALLLLRAAANAGAIPSIVFDAKVFINGPNKNNFHFYEKDVDSLAKSFIGKPFLKNHGQKDTDERLGKIINSWSVGEEIFQTIKLTTQQGILDFVEGKIDRFSIGIFATNAECSICGNDYFSHGDCSHFAGRFYDGVVCNAIWLQPEGIETSAVNVPAVDGTHILSLLNQKKYSEEKEMEEEVEYTTSQQEEQEDLGGEQTAEERAALLALSFISEDEDANAWLAESLNLPDIDNRLGAVEKLLNALRDDISQLAENIDRQNGLGTYVKRPWEGFSSVRENLQTVDNTETPMPKQQVRKPHQLATEQQKQKVGKTTPKANAGAAFMNKLKGGK